MERIPLFKIVKTEHFGLGCFPKNAIRPAQDTDTSDLYVAIKDNFGERRLCGLSHDLMYGLEAKLIGYAVIKSIK